MLSKRQVTTATAIALVIAAFAVILAAHQPASSVGSAVSTSLYDLGVDRRSARVDELIDLAVLESRRWNRDAVMVALSAGGVRADGTVDLESDEPVEVWVVSPTRVRSLSAVRRLEAIRRYRFTARGMRVEYARSGLGEGWDRWRSPPPPRCRVAELAAAVAPGDGTFRVRAQRQPSARDGASWRVERGGRVAHYRMTDCRPRARI